MYVPFSVFCVLFVCKFVLYFFHRVSTQLRLNIYIIYHIIYISYITSYIELVVLLRNYVTVMDGLQNIK
jgi:hypothetical protein